MSEYRWIPMLLALAAALSYFTIVIVGKTRLLLAAKPEGGAFDEIGARTKNALVFAFGQKKLFKEPAAGLMHALIFWGFLILLVRSTYLIIYAFAPGFHIPLVHDVYTLLKDVTELVVLAMVLYAAFRRVVTKPARLTQSHEALLVLGMIGGLMVTDFLFDGCLFALALAEGNVTPQLNSEMAHAPVGSFVASLLVDANPTLLLVLKEVFYWAHIGILLVFLNLLPGSKHFHVITAIPNVFFGSLKPKGAIAPIEDLEEQETFGISQVTEFTWKQVLDLYSCTECGRCTVNCPTTISGKPLNPKMLICNIRNHLYANEKPIVAKYMEAKGKEAKEGEGAEEEPLVSADGKTLVEAVDFDAIWDCTTCRACSEACPVQILHVDKIIDLRRNLVLMESNFPKELATTLRNLEQKDNPWGLPRSSRMEWAAGLDVPTVDDNPDAEYILWVGCAGAYDDRQKKVSRALAQLFKAAGLSFAVLGEEEGCCGDPARRAGNEYLFQMQAQANIEALKERGLDKKKFVTACPHGLNAIKNEYKQFGGDFDIVHHTTLLERLVADGKLKVDGAAAGKRRITFHDPCYLGRYNDTYDAPRQVLGALPGVSLVEMARQKQTAMCCGAGGARAFMEEDRGSRINQTRVEHARETKPDTIAVACPYCNMMLADGLNELQIEDIKAKDIAELLLECVPAAKS